MLPGAKNYAKNDLSETPDLEGHIPHGTLMMANASGPFFRGIVTKDGL